MIDYINQIIIIVEYQKSLLFIPWDGVEVNEPTIASSRHTCTYTHKHVAAVMLAQLNWDYTGIMYD